MNLLPIDGPALLVPLGVLGLIFGSFTTALSYRLPRGESVAHGRSRCPACGHTLEARDLVPVLSWVLHKGGCRHCGARVSWRYPAMELLMMALFIAAGLLVRDSVQLILLLVMTPMCVALAVIDIEHRRLPNSLIVALAVAAVGWRYVTDPDVMTAVITAAAAILTLVVLNRLVGMAGKRGVGAGDIKLFGLAGLALMPGPFLLFVTMAGVLGVISGLVVREGRTQGFPFGPAILSAYWITLAMGMSLLERLIMFRLG